MFEPRHLHPVAVIIRLFKMIKELIATILILLVGFPYKEYAYLGIAGIVLILIILSILHWWKYTYRIEENEFRVEHGIFIKKKRYVPIERIQTIHVSAGIIQRIFGLVKLQVETAGGSEDAEIELSAIHGRDAEQIQTLLREKKHNLLANSDSLEFIEETSKQIIYNISPKQLLITAATSSGIGIALSILAFFSQFDELFALDKLYEKLVERIEILSNEGVTAIILMVVLLLLVAWGISIIGVVLKFAHFSVELEDDQLIISRGLLEKQKVTVPIERIQAIQIIENPLRQCIGYATVLIDTAGNSTDEGIGTMLFPLIEKKRIKETIERFMDVTIQHEVHRLPRRALPRIWIKKLLWAFVLIIPLCIFLQPWGYLSLVLIPAVVILGYFQYRDGGWNIHENELTLSFRRLSKTTVIMERKRIQSIEMSSSFFQRRKRLATISSSVMSGFLGSHFSVAELDDQDAIKIVEWFSKTKREEDS
ncbi:PH domain-containing protein [Bacillus sp. FJAT-47783]|uniref:PH domain-containing protein n=1 Tax=Bacillus sp. FJAT-47783 TaxID=2922712 RepID=UPI001FAC3104|nr:PH domain-containing protein [Bacillus sp. FJAT-47783]